MDMYKKAKRYEYKPVISPDAAPFVSQACEQLCVDAEAATTALLARAEASPQCIASSLWRIPSLPAHKRIDRYNPQQRFTWT